MASILFRTALGAAALAGVPVAVRLRYGGGRDFPNRSTPAGFSPDHLEVVAELPHPPGNIAVSADERIFISLHPESFPPIKVAELVDGRLVPFPSTAFQSRKGDRRAFDNILGVRIDRQNRLWTLDNGTHGLRRGRLLAFDLDSGELAHHYAFPRTTVGRGSHLNDLQITHDGRYVLISDDGFINKKPALIVYDALERRSRRLLEGHYSVQPEFFTPRVEGRRAEILGLVSLRPGVDSIALDRRGEWLYFAPVTNRFLYRLRLTDVLDESLAGEELGRRVEAFATKTMSDGITTDDDGNIYVTDVEHSAIVRIRPDRRLETIVRDPGLLRWPDGFSFGPNGWLYVTCSAIHLYVGLLPARVRDGAPYHIVRLQTGSGAEPGH